MPFSLLRSLIRAEHAGDLAAEATCRASIYAAAGSSECASRECLLLIARDLRRGDVDATAQHDRALVRVASALRKT